MPASENVIFSVVMQFSKEMKEITPETVLYGYAKLLLMSEENVKMFIPEKNLKDLDKVRAVFQEKKLNLSLIKSGMMMLTQVIALDDDTEKKYKDYVKGLDKLPTFLVDSAELVKMAIETTIVPLQDVFGEGKSMENVFGYYDELKKQLPDAIENGKHLLKEVQNNEKSNNQPKETAKSEETPKESLGAGNDTPVKAEPESAKEDRKEDSNGKQEEACEESTAEGIEKLNELSEKYRYLSTTLYDVVKGQNVAIQKFVRGCFQGELLRGKEDHVGPLSHFFFFGPPGTGKTLLAKTAAENMGLPYRIFNMSEYITQGALSNLLDNLAFVNKQPHCVLVFDEIEKSVPQVIRLFLQILGSGTVGGDIRGQSISFKDAIIIFTSNAGRELYEDRSVNLDSIPESVFLKAIQEESDMSGGTAFPSEICSRIATGNMILFNHMSIRFTASLVNDIFEDFCQGMEDTYGCRVTYSSALPLLFVFSRGAMDARIATSQGSNFIKNEIYELTRQIENLNREDEEIKSIHLDIDWDSLSPELRALFFNESKAEVLVLADKKVRPLFAMDESKYTVYYAETQEEAMSIAMENNIAAAFIDPFFGVKNAEESVLSISDYNTQGVGFFHELVDANLDIPAYMLEVEHTFSEADYRTFLQEGAAGVLTIDLGRPEAFMREYDQTMDELYMENASQKFSQQGWVIGYNTKQDNSSKDGNIKILFYELKKRMAMDIDERKSFLSEEERPNVHFDDIIGAKKAKEELSDFIDFLKNPKKKFALGARPPKGILLYGPPGTGKTMLARAMAGEANVNFIQTSAAAFKDKYVGSSEENIRKVFARARKHAPAIIFIDEIDAIGKQRTGSEMTHTEESMLNTLLTEMDGFAVNRKKPVFVLAATNFGADSSSETMAELDEALLRRFDNKIFVGLPDEEDRKKYLRMSLDKFGVKGISDSVIDNIAMRTIGKSLAIIQNIMEMAARTAGRLNHDLCDDDLLTALEEYSHGEKREHTQEYFYSTAIHEAGHAYISYLNGITPAYITIESRGNFGGYMLPKQQEDKECLTKDELLGKIRCSLAGRASEMVFFDEKAAVNTGASSDLEHATYYAMTMLCRYGMFDRQLVSMKLSDVMQSNLARDYYARANEVLLEQMDETIRILEAGKDVVKKIADELVKKNRLTDAEFLAVVENK